MRDGTAIEDGVVPPTEQLLRALEDVAKARSEEATRNAAANMRLTLGAEAAAAEPLLEALIARATELDAAQHLADSDPLTGTANRRAFLAALEREVARNVRRGGKTTSVVMLDLDDLKRINDAWGHAEGDAALHTVARVATQQLRRSDLFARIGGDEFAILLPETSAAEAHGLALRVRSAVAEVFVNGTALGLSVGVATTASGETAIDATTLMSSADQALYEDKRRRHKARAA